MAAPTDSEGGATPRGEGRAPLRLADTDAAHKASGGQSSSDAAQMINALRARVDEEFRIMERLDAKARQAFAFVAAFFAVVQAVAFGAFAQTEVGSTDRAILAVLAAIAGVSVLVVGHHLRNEEELQRESDLKPDQILKWWDEASSENYVSVHLASGLAKLRKSAMRTTSIERRCSRSLTPGRGCR